MSDSSEQLVASATAAVSRAVWEPLEPITCEFEIDEKGQPEIYTDEDYWKAYNLCCAFIRSIDVTVWTVAYGGELHPQAGVARRALEPRREGRLRPQRRGGGAALAMRGL